MPNDYRNHNQSDWKGVEYTQASGKDRVLKREHDIVCSIWRHIVVILNHMLKLATSIEHKGHGVAVGYEAQQVFTKFDKDTQDELKLWGYELLLDLYTNELKYTDDVYAETGLGGKVKAYVRYNANKALMNLGLDVMFPEEEVDPIVMNGIRTDSVTHDFFSQKGNSYSIADVKPITDETFNFKGYNL